MGREDRAARKANYFSKLTKLLDDNLKCFIVGADGVSSNHMQDIRNSLRGKATILMGKNTVMKKAIREHLKTNPAVEKLLPYIKGNVGFVFAHGDLCEVRSKLLEKKVYIRAQEGAISPCAVVIPAHNTGLEPQNTSLFQALSIPFKIAKGTIEVLNDVHILKEGDRIGRAEVALLRTLLFPYGLKIHTTYNSGTMFEPKILDVKPKDIQVKFLEGIKHISNLSFNTGNPIVTSLPKSFMNGVKTLLTGDPELTLKIKTMKIFL